MANLVKPSKNIMKMNSGLSPAKCFLLSHYAACFTTYPILSIGREASISSPQ